MISDNDIKAEGIHYIAESPIFKNLTHLNVSFNDLREQGAQILSIYGSQLQYLNVSHNNIGENGCKSISESDSFPLLNTLIIYSGNNITLEGKKCFHRSKKLRSLNHIN